MFCFRLPCKVMSSSSPEECKPRLENHCWRYSRRDFWCVEEAELDGF